MQRLQGKCITRFVDPSQVKKSQPVSQKPNIDEIINKMAKTIHGKRDVFTPIGRIHLLSSNSRKNFRLYEFQEASAWQDGMGRLLAYRYYYPNDSLILVLIGDEIPQYLNLATKHCSRFDILVKTMEE